VSAENPAGEGGAPNGSAKNHADSTARDEYAECCIAARRAIDAAVVEYSRFELRVLLAALSLTALYSRLEDRVALVQVASIVYGIPTDSVRGFQRDRTATALRELAKHGVITYKAGTGRHAMAELGLPKTPQNACRDSKETHVDPVAETHVDPVAKPSTLGGHSEKVSEECSEERARTLAEELSERHKGAPRDEWRSLIAAQLHRGLTLEQITESVHAAGHAGTIWPSQYAKWLGRVDPIEEPRCERCGGRGWYMVDEEPINGERGACYPVDCECSTHDRARQRAVAA
jgi:hypothetical protein